MRLADHFGRPVLDRMLSLYLYLYSAGTRVPKYEKLILHYRVMCNVVGIWPLVVITNRHVLAGDMSMLEPIKHCHYNKQLVERNLVQVFDIQTADEGAALNKKDYF